MYQFEKLEIWHDSVDIVKRIYKITDHFPKEEKFSLTSQIQRAAVSVSLNIAEGKGSSYDKEFARFLNIALRSLHETVAALKLSVELGYTEETEDIAHTFVLMENLGGKIKSLSKKLTRANGQ